jgi:flagellar hook-length control protein FliK
MPQLPALSVMAATRSPGGAAHRQKPLHAGDETAFADHLEAAATDQPRKPAPLMDSKTGPGRAVKHIAARPHPTPEAAAAKTPTLPGGIHISDARPTVRVSHDPATPAQGHEATAPATDDTSGAHANSCENTSRIEQPAADATASTGTGLPAHAHPELSLAGLPISQSDDAPDGTLPDPAEANTGEHGAIRPTAARQGEVTHTGHENAQPANIAKINGKTGNDRSFGDSVAMPAGTSDRHDAADPITTAATPAGGDRIQSASDANSTAPAPATAASAPIATPRLIAEANHTIALRIGHALRTGESAITVDLHPAELGHVSVRLAFQNDGVDLRMVVARHETYQALTQDRPALEQELRNAGINLDSGGLDLRFGQSPDRTLEQGLAGGGQGSESATPETVQPPPRLLHGLLNIFA